MAKRETGSLIAAAPKYEEVREGEGISASLYNLIMGGLVAYGIIVNIIMCMTCTEFAMSMNPLVLLIGYIVLAIAGSIMINRSQSTPVRFIAYNMIVIPLGLVLSIILQSYGGINSDVVQKALIYTAIITIAMVLLSIAFPQFFSKIGGVLLGCLLGMILAYIVVALLKIGTTTIAYFGAALFSLYIGYDFWKSQQYPRTVGNAVLSACEIYLDIINLFLRLLEIFGNSSRD